MVLCSIFHTAAKIDKLNPNLPHMAPMRRLWFLLFKVRTTRTTICLWGGKQLKSTVITFDGCIKGIHRCVFICNQIWRQDVHWIIKPLSNV